MEPGIIILIIFFVVLILVGAGIGIYFLVRDDNSGNTGSTGTIPPNTPGFPNNQIGNKILPAIVGNANVGNSVAVSEDGTTMVVGAPLNNGGEGGVWVYRLSGGVWSLESSKLLGTGAVGNAQQGFSVTIDEGGNGIAIGGPEDDGGKGAVWIFTRSETNIWSQYGSKIMATGLSAGDKFGSSVAVNDTDFTYLAVGAPFFNEGQGGVWTFVRTGGLWVEEGSRKFPSDSLGSAYFGTSIRLTDAADAFVAGGPGDNGDIGAFWVFVRNQNSWAQTGLKHIPNGYTGAPRFGFSVAFSGTEGNTLAVGGPGDDADAGAVWMYVRNGNNLAQQGKKLVASNAVGKALQGFSVRISDNGRTLLVGAPSDDSSKGAAFTWTRNELLTWEQTGKLVGTGNSGPSEQGYSVALSRDGVLGVVGGRNDDGGKGAVWTYNYLIS